MRIKCHNCDSLNTTPFYYDEVSFIIAYHCRDCCRNTENRFVDENLFKRTLNKIKYPYKAKSQNENFYNQEQGINDYGHSIYKPIIKWTLKR